MTEELNRKADHLSLAYKTKYSEDRTLKDMLSRPKDFVEGAIEGIINLLRQKAWRDGYIAGAEENGIQWHDLRKGPNDLPVMETELLCQKYSGRCFVGYYNHADKKFYPYEKGNSYDVVDIVRWADIGIWWNIPTV